MFAVATTMRPVEQHFALQFYTVTCHSEIDYYLATAKSSTDIDK